MIYACKQHKSGCVWVFDNKEDQEAQLNLVARSGKGKYLGLVEFKEYPALGVSGKRLRLLTIEDPEGDLTKETGPLDHPILYYISADSFYAVVDIFTKTEEQ